MYFSEGSDSGASPGANLIAIKPAGLLGINSKDNSVNLNQMGGLSSVASRAVAD